MHVINIPTRSVMYNYHIQHTNNNKIISNKKYILYTKLEVSHAITR